MRPHDAYPWLTECFADYRQEAGVYCSAQCCLKCHRNARLKFWLGTDGRLMFGCHAGCAKLEILRAVGKRWSDTFPGNTDMNTVRREVTATYVYHDERKRALYQKLRWEPGFGGSDKTFSLRRPDGRGGWLKGLDDVRRVLYRLPQLLDADPNALVFKVAGEKDADTLTALGLVATTNVGGEREDWSEEYSQHFADRDVVVIQDDDGTGRRHANEVCGALMTVARSIRRVCLPQKDATAFVNYLRAHEGVTDRDELCDRLWAVCEQYQKWEQQPAPVPLAE